MSEHKSEHRIALDGMESVEIFNPVGRVVVSGWEEPDLFLNITVTLPGDRLSEDTVAPQIERSGKVLSILPPKSAMAGDQKIDIPVSVESDMEDFSGDFSSGFSDFIGKIVFFAQSSGKKVPSGAKISMEVRMPKTMPVTVKNLNGVIAVSNMESSVQAKGLNGPVSLHAMKGPVVAKTVNGPVSIEKSHCPEVTLKSVNGPVKCYLTGMNGPVSLKTVNGPVRVMIPQHADVDLTVKTLHGAIKISSDFVSHTKASRHNRSTLNAGHHTMSIKSTTGAITVITTDEPRHASTQQPSPSAAMTAKPHEPAEKASQPRTDSLETQIDRMLSSGKITAEEAERLRKAI